MARKKQEVQLLRELESQEEWEEVLGKEGLWVIDVYQEWCGPCDAMVGNFRRIKNELGDDLLHFAMAKADNIDALEKYRGSCEPCFLFYAGGLLVSYVHGANAPLILRTLTEQLAYEHKVLDGSAERKEVKDPFVASKEADVPKDEEEEEGDESGYVPHRRLSALPEDYETVEAGFTVAIIKPNAVAEGKVDEIIAEMQAKGIKVMAQEERQLTEEEAREFYAHLKNEDYYDDLCKFMASGPSHALVLTKGQTDDSVIKDWRDMLGPPVVEEAKEQAPDSLRAKYGEAGLMNALHGSDSKDTAAKELAFFFPNMHAPTITRKVKEVQRTLALIRPDAFAQQKDEILARIQEAGFHIALQKVVQLSREQAMEFYKEHEGQPYFEELVERMSSGPLLALGLARDDAVEGWRSMLGPADVEEAKQAAPDSLRAQFAVEDNPINQLHGSDSPETAKKELQFFFPMEQTVAMIKPDAYGTKEAIIDKIHQAGFRIAARKETTITPDIAQSFYEDQKDKEYFDDLVQHMCSGPTMFMVLSREDAVEGWRNVIGPTDPEKAKAEAPDTLRAQFGTDVLHNAIHGCSTKEQAAQKIEKIFGHLEFNPDGTVKEEEPEQEAEEQAEQQQQQEQQEAGEQQQTQQEQQQETQEQQQETQQETQQEQQETQQEQQETQQEQQETQQEQQETQQEQSGEPQQEQQQEGEAGQGEQQAQQEQQQEGEGAGGDEQRPKSAEGQQDEGGQEQLPEPSQGQKEEGGNEPKEGQKEEGEEGEEYGMAEYDEPDELEDRAVTDDEAESQDDAGLEEEEEEEEQGDDGYSEATEDYEGSNEEDVQEEVEDKPVEDEDEVEEPVDDRPGDVLDVRDQKQESSGVQRGRNERTDEESNVQKINDEEWNGVPGGVAAGIQQRFRSPF